MFAVLQVVATMLVALAAVTSVAHALELPGKLRLDREAYYTVQPIYYPGFTFAGFTEPLAIIATAVLLLLTPSGTPQFWLVLLALVGMIIMHAIYWLLIHPVNNFWVAGRPMNAAAATFFAVGARREAPAWTELRDRWEYSHLARGILSSVSLLALVISLAT